MLAGAIEERDFADVDVVGGGGAAGAGDEERVGSVAQGVWRDGEVGDGVGFVGGERDEGAVVKRELPGVLQVAVAEAEGFFGLVGVRIEGVGEGFSFCGSWEGGPLAGGAGAEVVEGGVD